MSKLKSQLRQDLVSGDWIVIAPGRAKRPSFFRGKRKEERGKKRIVAPKSTCPFENPQLFGHGKPILLYEQTSTDLMQFNTDKSPRKSALSQRGSAWTVQIVENKYPAFTHRNICAAIGKVGHYALTETAGHHDLLITRDHNKNFPRLSKKQASQVLEAFRDRYLMLLNDKCLAYVFILHNWGPKAGASIYHPHYQIIAMPIIPPDVMHSLRGSERYFKKNKKCVHCVMIEWEKKQKKRLVYENDGAVAFAPFVSKNPYEVRIFPKKHLSYFENTLDSDIDYVADALQNVLRSMEKKLKDPDYNFFIHTAPIQDKKKYQMYHWHMEITPKTNINAGFELGTGIEINDVDPDQAAKLLRN